MFTRRSFLTTVAALAASNAYAGPCWNRVLRLAHRTDIPPYAYFDQESGKMRGILVDLLDALAGFGDFSIVHNGFPLARAQNLVAAGSADVFCFSASAQRRDYVLFAPTPIMTMTQDRIYYSAANPKADSIAASASMEEIYRFKTVSLIGDDRSDVIWHNHPQRTLVSEFESMIKMLVFGHADFILADPIVMNFKLRELGMSNRVESISGCFVAPARPEQIQLGLRKSFPDAQALVECIDADIRRHITPSLYQQITSRYGPRKDHPSKA